MKPWIKIPVKKVWFRIGIPLTPASSQVPMTCIVKLSLGAVFLLWNHYFVSMIVSSPLHPDTIICFWLHTALLSLPWGGAQDKSMEGEWQIRSPLRSRVQTTRSSSLDAPWESQSSETEQSHCISCFVWGKAIQLCGKDFPPPSLTWSKFLTKMLILSVYKVSI
jgi:hypothetical protein